MEIDHADCKIRKIGYFFFRNAGDNMTPVKSCATLSESGDSGTFSATSHYQPPEELK